ncbi:ricin-type beta-trefoil lectin domain protein [Streptomyces sp. NPDC019396]|uniref:ricin-type beta-trefoil lectin domain protein n=1 Tax=Streptomyces sp. NPDC019396 TaxID=3154687 RepID=UPI0033DADC35
MSLWTSLEPASATVDPGGTTTVRLRVRNTGDVVDEYRFEPVGDIAPWTRVEPQTLRLYPGTTGTVELTFTPPRTPDATAGPNPYAVRISPTEHPEATTVPEGNLTITPFTEVRAEIVPPTVKGRFRGRPKLAIDNIGNTRLTCSVAGSDNGDDLSYEIHPSSVQIEPGRAAFLNVRLRPREIIWFGSKERRPYTLAVQRSGVDPLNTEGTYVQRGFLPRWLATFLGILLALAITFVMLWITYKPQVRSAATEKPVEAGVVLPDPAASPEEKPSEEPEKPAEPSEEPETDPGPEGGGGGEPDTEPAPEEPAAGSVIIGQGSDLCIDVTDAQDGGYPDGTQLQIWGCAGSANQKWEFLEDGTVRSLGLCMDVANGSRDDGAAIQMARCSGNPAQTFVLSEAGDLVNPQADKCVDAFDQGTENGTKLVLWTCNGQSNQKWRVE